MTSILFNIVPVLNSTNWVSWSEAMDAYVMSEGRCQVFPKARPRIPLPVTGTNGDVKNQSDINKATTAQNNWNQDNERVMGYIRLRVSPDVAQLVKGKSSAKEM
jgi:hypothetical protein